MEHLVRFYYVLESNNKRLHKYPVHFTGATVRQSTILSSNTFNRNT